MTIFLNREIVVELAHTWFGGFDQLATDWEALSELDPALPRTRSRTALYRWLSDGVPVKSGADRYLFLVLSGLLDVDPLCIFDFERNGYFSKFTKIRQLIYLGDPGRTSLAPVFDLYRPGEHWPSDTLARMYLRMEWKAHVFSNENFLSQNDYDLIKLDFDHGYATSPKAMHIAYRRMNFPDRMWRYYGCVIAYKGSLRLYSESGDFQFMNSIKEREVRFRTYFGGRLVQFKIVSLHDLKFDLDVPFSDTSVIGFEW